MKRFFENTLISGAYNKALRVVALLCVLLGVSTSAMGETYYLWYGSNDDYNNSNNYKWSEGVSFSNNKGTFTINTSYWNCYVYIAKGSNSTSNLLKTPKFANPTTSTGVSNLYQGNRDGYNRIQFTTGTDASKSFTIECDFSNSSEYTFKVNTGSSSGGDSGGGNSGSGDSGSSTNSDCQTIYLKPNIWGAGTDEHFYAHFWDSGNNTKDVKLKKATNCDGIFYVGVEKNFKNVIFVRKNPSSDVNNIWDGAWNQTIDLTISGSNNLYTINNWNGQDGKSTGTWSTSTCDETDCSADSGDTTTECYLIGSFNSWNYEDPNFKMVQNPGNANESMIRGVTLNANTELKIYMGSIHYGFGYVSSNSTDVPIEKSAGDKSGEDYDNIKILETGTYDFYFDRVSKTIYIGYTGGNSDIEPGKCDRIEIYCKYEENDDADMKLHMWGSGGSPLTPSDGKGIAGTHEYVDGVKYAKWSYETTSTNLCVQFIAGNKDNYRTSSKCDLPKGNKYFFSLGSNWGSENENQRPGCSPFKIEEIDCDDDDDAEDGNAEFDCESIEIWCRTSNGNTDMWCYAWTNNNTELLGGWRGSKSNVKGYYNDQTYAVWKISGHDQINVIFSSENAQTGDLNGYKKGNRYIFTINDSYNALEGDVKKVECGGGSGSTVSNGTIYLDIASLTDWDDAGAVLKAKVTDTSGATVEYDLTQCATENTIYFIDEILDLNNISKVNMIRYNETGTSIWNQTGEITFNSSVNTVKLTSWSGNYANYQLTVYSGACGVASSSPVLIANEASVASDGKTVTLYGYLQETFCENISEYGFIYCGGSATKGCTPTKNSPKIKVTSGAQLYRGEVFSATTTLPVNTTYGYKAYVMVGELMYISNETGFFTLGDCSDRPKNTSTITYTVDASLGESHADPCTLTYGNLQAAIDHLRNANSPSLGEYQYVDKIGDGESYNLKQPVIMNVVYYDDTPNNDKLAYIYRGTTQIGKYAGDNKPKDSNLLENINYTATNDSYTLTIKAGNKVAKPWIHHMVIRKSRNIVLDSLCIYSDPNNVGDNALEMDKNIASGRNGWNTLNSNGYVDNANIVIKNCMIGSDGFTGMHISSYNGITFKNNDFESVFESDVDNDINYGASAKFMYCKNIKFIENNFRGDHATLMWIQEVQNMLVMNNVFWNTNKYLQKSGTHVPSAMRIVTQWNETKNIGFYYNTYYFALNDKVSDSKYNFIHFSHTVDGGSGSYNLNTMYFKYNNCYSYDTDCPGSESINLGGNDANFCPNNFWSAKADADFAFAKDCNSESVNVKEQVCSTTATGPSSLMVRGEGLNKGVKPSQEELNKIGISLTAEEQYSDRYYSNVREGDSGWTYGAYQSKDNVPVSKIYWIGKTSDWDDRGNWEYDYTDPVTKETTRIKTSCVNTFTENLEVVIEEVASKDLTEGRKWPVVPESFTQGRKNYEYNEHVSAGATAEEKGTMFADKITVEYGAGIIGVEYLTNGTRHYREASIGFIAPRKKWILVGTVVKPRDETLGTYRNMKSGDYYIQNQTPHVYMHKAELVETRNGDKVEWKTNWDETFTSLEESVEPTTVFTIQIPDQYGKYKLPARYYGSGFNPDEPIEYGVYKGTTGPFTGIFVNESQLPKYENMVADVPVLINNTYPANIDADLLEGTGLGTVQYYSNEANTFLNTSSTTEKILLRPQHGFVFTPKQSGTLTIPSSVFVDGNTRSRSARIELPAISINLYNANTGVEYSNVVVKVDELLAEGEQAVTNVEKVFSPNDVAPEIYIMANDAMYSRFTVNSKTTVIPLGVRIKQDMNIKFKKEYFKNFENVTLVDVQAGKEVDLLRNSYTTETLVAGNVEGRFYLNLSLASNNEETPDDDNVSTEVDEMESNISAINIYVSDDNTIRVVTNQVELKAIYVSDMAGRTMKYDVRGFAANLNLPVAQGVYTVNVIGDTATKTGKVILK